MGTDAADASQVKMGFSRVTGCCSLGNKSFLLSVLGFIFVILNLAALWALHFADRPVTKGSLRSATRFSTGLLGASDGVTPQVGDAVSFNSDNVLRAGAGTTGYLNRLTLGASATNVAYVNFAPMGTTAAYYSTNVMSYAVTDADSNVKNIVTTVTYDPATKNLTVADIDATKNVASDAVRGLATLSDTKLIVLTNKKSAVTKVLPATLDGSTGKVTLDAAKSSQVTDSSPTNFIAALSSSAFVVAYYEEYDKTNGYYQSVKAGTVATDGTITLTSTGVNFGEKNTEYLGTNFGSPLALKALATTSDAGFVIPYFNTVNTLASSNPKTSADLVGLCVASSTYLFSTKVVDTFTTVCNTAYRPAQYIQSVALGDDAMAIIFLDGANSNALTLVTLKVVDSAFEFRGSYVFDVSGDFDYGKDPYGFWDTPCLRVLSGNRLAVSFLNPNLAGRLSTQILGFSPVSLSFKELTPILPVALPSFTLATTDATKSAGAITHDLLPVGSDSFMTAFVGSRDDIVHQNFNVLEVYSKPVGIIQSYSDDGTAAVATQGRVDVDGLTSGEFHYATTLGTIVAKDSASSSSNSSEYVYAAGDSVLVTTDSRVGMALDDDTLFVSTSF